MSKLGKNISLSKYDNHMHIFRSKWKKIGMVSKQFDQRCDMNCGDKSSRAITPGKWPKQNFKTHLHLQVINRESTKFEFKLIQWNTSEESRGQDFGWTKGLIDGQTNGWTHKRTDGIISIVPLHLRRVTLRHKFVPFWGLRVKTAKSVYFPLL